MPRRTKQQYRPYNANCKLFLFILLFKRTIRSIGTFYLNLHLKYNGQNSLVKFVLQCMICLDKNVFLREEYCTYTLILKICWLNKYFPYTYFYVYPSIFLINFTRKCSFVIKCQLEFGWILQYFQVKVDLHWFLFCKTIILSFFFFVMVKWILLFLLKLEFLTKIIFL